MVGREAHRWKRGVVYELSVPGVVSLYDLGGETVGPEDDVVFRVFIGKRRAFHVAHAHRFVQLRLQKRSGVVRGVDLGVYLCSPARGELNFL